jgi:carbonic anhydrase/acetyltransferase-like protein (isoleucine patch superfamily)
VPNVTIESFNDKQPIIANDVFIHDTALVIGDVQIGEDASIWPKSVVRGDIHSIQIGARTNVQDNSVLHVTHDSKFNPGGYPLIIGDEVTVGHSIVLHGCTVGDQCLIGMGAVVMDGAVIESGTMLGAGSLVTPGKVLESGYLWLGSPARKVRELNEQEKEYLQYSAEHYVRLKNRYMNNI